MNLANYIDFIVVPVSKANRPLFYSGESEGKLGICIGSEKEKTKKDIANLEADREIIKGVFYTDDIYSSKEIKERLDKGGFDVIFDVFLNSKLVVFDDFGRYKGMDFNLGRINFFRLERNGLLNISTKVKLISYEYDDCFGRCSFYGMPKTLSTKIRGRRDDYDGEE